MIFPPESSAIKWEIPIDPRAQSSILVWTNKLDISNMIKLSTKAHTSYQSLYDNCIERIDFMWDILYIKSQLSFTKWGSEFLHGADTLCPIIKWMEDSGTLKEWEYISIIHDIRWLKNMTWQITFLISENDISLRKESHVMRWKVETNEWKVYYVAWYENWSEIKNSWIEKNPVANNTKLLWITESTDWNLSWKLVLQNEELDMNQWLKISWFLDILNNIVVNTRPVFLRILDKANNKNEKRWTYKSRIIWWYSDLAIPLSIHDIDKSQVTIVIKERKETKSWVRLVFVEIKITNKQWESYWWQVVAWV